MSRSLGLREDQRAGEVLARQIAGLLALEPEWARQHELASRRRLVLLMAPSGEGLRTVGDEGSQAPAWPCSR